ncbi:MAG: glycosyltransferase family 2 protein [Nitrospirae bacterium]|nr:glycosyltransferase family 2 protein [Nitrospirota bacterium]
MNPLTIFKSRVIRHLKRRLQPFYIKAAHLFLEKKAYHAWILTNEPDTAALAAQRAYRFGNMPYFAVVCVVNPEFIEHIPDIIASLKGQTYVRWRLYLLSDSTEHVRKYLGIEENIRLIDSSLPPDEIISAVDGDFIVAIGQNTILCPFALYEITASINTSPTGKLFYSDEDALIGGKRASPHFKPDSSPDTLRSFNYIGPFMAITRELFVSEQPLSAESGYALALKYTQEAGAVIHIRKVLFHTAGKEEGSPTTTTAKKALSCHLTKLGVAAEVEELRPGLFNVIYKITDAPRVSIIIPNKDNAELLAKCVKSIIYKTAAYDNYEIVIVENGSIRKDTFTLYDTLKRDKRIRIINWQGEFNYARVNNYGALESGGAILLFLNNDIEAVNADWLVNMLRHAVRKDVGAVGAKLYYPDGTIQHGGIVVGVGGVAVEYHKGFDGSSAGYFNRLAIVHNVAAVTGACLMLRRELFDKVNGFDESYALAYNDVDLCLRLMELGYPAVWTPFSQLIHSESRTRGYEVTQAQRQRLNEESVRFTMRWRHILDEGDPYYNPNLSRGRGDFTPG